MTPLIQIVDFVPVVLLTGISRISIMAVLGSVAVSVFRGFNLMPMAIVCSAHIIVSVLMCI